MCSLPTRPLGRRAAAIICKLHRIHTVLREYIEDTYSTLNDFGISLKKKRENIKQENKKTTNKIKKKKCKKKHKTKNTDTRKNKKKRERKKVVGRKNKALASTNGC